MSNEKWIIEKKQNEKVLESVSTTDFEEALITRKRMLYNLDPNNDDVPITEHLSINFIHRYENKREIGRWGKDTNGIYQRTQRGGKNYYAGEYI